MQLDRQDYKDADLAQASTATCDIVQLKYDGWWDRIVIKQGRADHYTRTQRIVRSDVIQDTSLDCVLIAELMHGTQWSQHPERLGQVFVFDCWAWGDMSLLGSSYRDRYRVARMAVQALGKNFNLVPCYPFADVRHLWNQQVINGDFEGLVFRRGSDSVAFPVYRHKKTVTDELVCDGFNVGQGKYANTLGALRGHNRDGVEMDVGGGLTDAQRDEIWANQSAYLGRTFEVEAKARFESGSLRHPNFIRWRDDLIEPHHA